MKAASGLKTWVQKFKSSGCSTFLEYLKTSANVEKELKGLDELIDLTERNSGPPGLLQQASVMRSRMEAEMKMIEDLKKMATSLDSVAIDKAVAKAANVGMTKGADIDALKSRSDKLNKQMPLKTAMEDAIKNEDMEQLKVCYDEVKKISADEWLPGVNGAELAGHVYSKMEDVKTKMKQQKFRDEQKAQAQAAVFAREEDVAKKEATAFVEEVVVPKKSRKTVTGISEEKSNAWLLELQAAGNEYDVDKMDEFLRLCTKNAVPKDKLQAHKALFAKLQTEEFLHASILEVEEDVKGGPKGDEEVSDTSIKSLQNLATQLHKICGDELALQEAQEIIQGAMAKRTRAARGRAASAFDMAGKEGEDADDEEVSMAISAYELANFPNLKKRFRGHGGIGVFARLGGASGRGNIQIMVSHTKDELKEALTVVPNNLERQAVQNFRDVLGWMSEKPVPETRRLSYSHDIVDTAKTSPPMSDEVYCQVMKQLTNNPNPHSILMGWKLLLMLCQETIPSPELREFVRAFLSKNIRALRPVGGETLVIARHAFEDLNRYIKEHESESIEAGAGEDGGDAGPPPESAPMMDVQITLVDHTTRKIKVKETATLIEAGDALATAIRLHRIQDFRFFHLLVADENSGEIQRLLPMQTKVKTLFDKWTSLEAKSKKKSRLLLKRIWMDNTEVLRPGDMTHANLTYRQVVREFLHYPVWEEQKLVSEISASMLLAERDHLRINDALKRGDLSGPGDLEQAVPEHMLKFDKDRKKWSKVVTGKLKELEQFTEATEPRLQRMTRVLVQCQKMKLFGTMHWFCRQTVKLTAERVNSTGVENLPKGAMKLNDKQPEGEYWINVNRSGIFFVPFDAGPGDNFKKSFLFDAEAMDRVLRWGFKQDLLQLVVSACDRENMAAGVVEWCISLLSPSAPDIWFALTHAKPGTSKR